MSWGQLLLRTCSYDDDAKTKSVMMMSRPLKRVFVRVFFGGKCYNSSSSAAAASPVPPPMKTVADY